MNVVQNKIQFERRIFMRDIPIVIFEAIVAISIVFLGLSGKKILFVQSARSAVITLGIIGMLLCTMSVGKFISSSPAHPLSILGYIFGTIALAAFIIQLFKWNVPILVEPKTALIVLAASMVAKGVIARFGYILIK